MFDTARHIKLTPRVVVPWNFTPSGGVKRRPESIDSFLCRSIEFPVDRGDGDFSKIECAPSGSYLMTMSFTGTEGELFTSLSIRVIDSRVLAASALVILLFPSRSSLASCHTYCVSVLLLFVGTVARCFSCRDRVGFRIPPNHHSQRVNGR